MLRFLIFAAILLLGTLAIYHYTSQQAMNSLADRAENRLTLFISNLDGTLDEYRSLPRLLSSNPRLFNTLQGERLDAVNDTNLYLQSVAETTGASDVYLMALDGETLAASNWREPHSFIGRNFSYRPYFQAARSGEQGRYFALGTTSGVRGYYLSHPVMHTNNIIGVIVVKVNLANIESAWSENGNHILVTDDDGVIFLSTHQDWTYKSLLPIAERRLRQIHDGKRYADKIIRPIAEVTHEAANRNFNLLRLDGRQYLQVSRLMPDAGWRVHLLADTDAAHTDGRLRATVAAFGLLLLITLVALYLINRQRRMALQFSTEKLEQRVQERTLDLKKEIEVRTAAEQSLRDTQAELIQAAKMAGLGQMSAGLSHELNQPLTAIRNFSENAQRLLERKQLDQVSDNLAEITDITERIAAIITQLRGFSRKSSGERSSVSVAQAVAQALGMFTREIDSGKVRVETDIDPELSLVTDPQLFNQVLVNLINNALQAMHDMPERCITINAVRQSGGVMLEVSDTGTGIAEDVIENIFDPFFTTKTVGLGLGLGLSISYRIMETLGGRIDVANNPGGGARFGLYLADV